MKEEYKPKIIQVSFKTTDIEDKLLYNWVLEKVKETLEEIKVLILNALFKKRDEKELKKIKRAAGTGSTIQLKTQRINKKLIRIYYSIKNLRTLQ